MFPVKRSQTQRRLIKIFTPAALDSSHGAPLVEPDQGAVAAVAESIVERHRWEWAVLLLAAGAGAGWSTWAGSSARALPFCLGALVGLALAIFARGGWSALAFFVAGAASFVAPESARVPWVLGAALGLVLAARAPVALILSGASAFAIYSIREAREQTLPWQTLGALLLGGAVVAALMRTVKPKESDEFWPLGALSIIGGALGAQTLAQGAGLASFALGGALGAQVVGKNSADDATKNLWALSAIIALWRALEAQIPALRFGADAGDLTVLWGALIVAALVHYRTRALAPLACALAPLTLWFVWGPKVVSGLFLGALLAPLLRARAWPHAAVAVCAVVGLAPLIESLPPQTRADKLIMGAALVATWLLFDALIKWQTRERTI